MLLADEPTANLDYVQAEGIISLLRDLRADGRLIIVSSHDDRLVPIADRVVHLVAGLPRGRRRPPRWWRSPPARSSSSRAPGASSSTSSRPAGWRSSATTPTAPSELLAELGPGEYFGELGPLLGFPRSATARALTSVRLMAYNVHDFREQVVGATAATRTGSPSEV